MRTQWNMLSVNLVILVLGAIVLVALVVKRIRLASQLLKHLVPVNLPLLVTLGAEVG